MSGTEDHSSCEYEAKYFVLAGYHFGCAIGVSHLLYGKTTGAGCVIGVLIGTLGLLVLCIAFACYIERYEGRHHLAARKDRQLREGLPPRGKWPDRGWLVMLRALNRSALETSKGWPALLALCCTHRRAKPTLRGAVVLGAAAEGTGNADHLFDANMERCEGGRSSSEFTKLVVAIVKIEEEGLFRNIVTFL